MAGVVNWTVQSPEEQIKREVLRRYFVCQALIQRMDLYKLQYGKYPERFSREFITHSAALYRSVTPMINKLKPSDVDEIHKIKGISNKLEKSFKMFYKLSNSLRATGILSLSLKPSLGNKGKGRAMMLGTG